MRKGLAVALALMLGVAFAASLPARKSEQGGVTVVVRPESLAADVKQWKFNVAVDTHTQELKDDLAKAAVLVDDRGTEAKPSGWKGSGPGGHHRTGVLTFDAFAPPPKFVELRIHLGGEPSPRVFRWTLG